MNYEIFARSYSEGETIRYHRMNETRGTPDERRWYMAPIVFVGKLAVPPEEWDDDPKTYEEIDPILETEKLNYEIDDTKAKNESKIRLANLPKPKSSNDPVFSYTDEQRRSIEEIVGMEEWYRRSFIRVIVRKTQSDQRKSFEDDQSALEIDPEDFGRNRTLEVGLYDRDVEGKTSTIISRNRTRYSGSSRLCWDSRSSTSITKIPII